jgi:hypothetical protein
MKKNPNITATPMNINGREFILAEVTRGLGKLGTFRYVTAPTTATDVFFIGNEPIINIFSQHTPEETTDKVIQQISGVVIPKNGNMDFVTARLTTVTENYYRYNQGMVRSIMPVLELLGSGLYIVHEAQMHPGDGAGHFFWNAYNQPRELNGSADKNATIGDGNFTPSFLIPTQQPSDFNAQKMYSCVEKRNNGQQLAGVAYHVSGMFSALLTGHHAATASLLSDSDFKCLVIEPLNEVLYSVPVEPDIIEVSEDGDTHESRRIIALACPYVSVPLEQLPENALERFLITRKNIKPPSFDELKHKMTKIMRTVSKKAFPGTLYEKAKQLPECAVIEEAAAVNHLSEEQIAALSKGEVRFEVVERVENEEGEMVETVVSNDFIISPNYHTSMVAACNYLQVNDFGRYMAFATDILKNEEMASSHKYISERLLGTMHPALNEFFTEIAADSVNHGKVGIITEVARQYITQYTLFIDKKRESEDSYNQQRKKNVENMQAITEAKGIATLEAAVRSIGDMPR